MRDLIAERIHPEELIRNGRLIYAIDSGVKQIDGTNTFDGVTYLAKDIHEVDPSCFYSASVMKIFVEKENSNYAAKGGVLFNKNQSILVRFPPQSPEEIYTVPDGVVVIGAHAFQNAET